MHRLVYNSVQLHVAHFEIQRNKELFDGSVDPAPDIQHPPVAVHVYDVVVQQQQTNNAGAHIEQHGDEQACQPAAFLEAHAVPQFHKVTVKAGAVGGQVVLVADVAALLAVIVLVDQIDQQDQQGIENGGKPESDEKLGQYVWQMGTRL